MNLLVSPADIWAFLCWFFSWLSNWGLLLFTGLLVVVGFLQYLMLKVTWKAVHIAERPWLIITPIKLKLPEQTSVAVRLNVLKAAMKNVGRTPAYPTKIVLCYKNLDKSQFDNLLKKREPDYGTEESLEGLILVPQDSFGRTVSLQPSLTDKDIESILAEQSFLYFYARIKYNDAFGKKHETRVGFVYDDSRFNDENHGFQHSGPPAYNRAT
jgi:hypothetical protein